MSLGRRSRTRISLLFIIALLIVGGAAGGVFLFKRYRPNAVRSGRVVAWITNPGAHPEWAVLAGERCEEAPFIFPTFGFAGFLWDDSFRPGHRHQGIDIFGGAEVGITPVIAAYPGYLTRLADWKSSLIVRIPEDPLDKNRQIWTYYTHMADPHRNSLISSEFPPGTSEIYVEAGDLLGYQGNYSGDPGNPVGTHLHFSIVLDDGENGFRNELDIRNTLDPSPYLGLPLNANTNRGETPKCVSALER
jgi:murein DD-endopeptidase MepM/ murein hydrolase activator NlpD